MDATLTDKQVLELEIKATKLREMVIEMLYEAGSGHSAGPLGMADIFAAFYFYILKHDSQNPLWEERDRLVLSNGHICPIQYAALALSGYFEVEKLKTLRKIGTALQGHPKRGSVPGLETTSGPLGEGLSQAIGMALAARLDGKGHAVYCLMSDGEHQEGNTWEAVMFAGKNRLSNLIAVIDRNNIQIDGFTEDVMPLEPLKEKYKAFNWEVIETNGNNVRDFVAAIAEAQAISNRPTVIIARTIPGMGVDFMEKDFNWHGKTPNNEETQIALKTLRTLEGKIESELD